MKSSEAVAAGLLDPEIATRTGNSRMGGTPAGRAGEPATGESGEAPRDRSRKRNRQKSRPAAHPSRLPGPHGRGSVEVLADGRIAAAEFVFDVVPVPKERARVVRNRKTDTPFGFTPDRTKHFTVAVQEVVREVMAARPAIDGPVRLEMAFVVAIPQSWPKWKQAAARDGLIAPTARPDMDNLEKALLDAFNGFLIVDDAFVVERTATKVYGDVPAILARVVQTGQSDIHARREAVAALRRLREEGEDGAGA